MHLEELELRGAYQLTRLPAKLTGLRPGLILLTGPNGIGKTTLGRAVMWSLWPDKRSGSIDARSVWVDDQGARAVATVGMGQTVWAPEIALPSADLCAPFSLKLSDLMNEAGRSDVQIARRIQEQLDGGFNLSALLKATDGPKRPSRNLTGALKATTAQIRELEASADDLARRERDLEGVSHEIAEAQTASEALSRVRNAQSLLARRGQLAAVEAAIQALPEGVEGLPSDLMSRAQALKAAVEEAQAAKSSVEVTLAGARDAVEALAFPGREPSEAEAARWVDRAQALEGLQAEVGAADDAVARAEGAQQATAEALWLAPPSDRAGLDATALEAIDEITDQLNRAKGARDQHLEAPQVVPPALTEAELGSHREGMTHLRTWLSVPTPSGEDRRVPRWVWPAMGAVGTLLVLWGLSAIHQSPGALALGLGGCLIGAAAVGYWRSRGGGDDDATTRRAEAARSFGRTGAPNPTRWTFEAVSEALERLRETVSQTEEALAQAQALTQANREREAAERRVSETEASLGELIERLGLRPELSVSAVKVVVSRLLVHGEAVATLAAEAHSQAQKQRRLEAARATLGRELMALGLPDVPEPSDARDARVVSEAVKERVLALANAKAEAGRTQTEVERETAALGAAVSKRDDFLQRLGTEDDSLASLEALQHSRGAYDKHRANAEALKLAIDQLVPDSIVAVEETEEALAAEAARLEAAMGTLGDLQKARAEIEERIKLALGGTALFDQHTEARATRDQLADECRTARKRAIREAMIAQLRHSGETEQLPKLLERARNWFFHFTRNRYQLEVDTRGHFVALDTHLHARQPLSALSDATRVQLLLAARLAFIEEAEGAGSKVPLYLDELLSTTDLARYRAVAQAVMALVDQGRQIFYVTADDTEVVKWRAVADELGFEQLQCFALDAEGNEDDWMPAPALPTARAEVPRPGDLDAITYTATLGIGRPTLHDPVALWPLPIVLYDQLEAAHRAAQEGLRHAGQLDLADKGLSLPLANDVLALARARVRALGGAITALRVGRGRPATWEDIAASGAVSATFQARVQERLCRHPTDPEAFMASLGDIKRFGKRQQALRDYFETTGILDPRDALSVSEVVEHALLACREDLEAGISSWGEVEGLVELALEVFGLRGSD